MINPVRSAARARGTMTDQPIVSIAIHAARTVCTSRLVAADTPSARYATTAPIQPTDSVRCVASTNFRMPGVIITARDALLGGRRVHHCGRVVDRSEVAPRPVLTTTQAGC